MLQRKIWQEPSAELRKRLSSPGCLEYKCLYDEHMDLCEEYFKLGKSLDDDGYELSSKNIDALYERLSDDDKVALEEEWEIEELNLDVSSYLSDAARHVGLSKKVWSVGTEQQYIDEVQQAQYIYPEYSKLVGPPSKRDFADYGMKQGIAECWMESERKADLLLMGVFEWNGLYIARAHCQTDKDPRGWLVCTNPDYVPKDALGAKRVGPNRGQLAFTPFHGVRTQWLHDYLFNCDVELGNREARGGNQYITFKDGNPYNCLPDNLILAQKRRPGRPMLCQSCGKETTREDSMVISERSRKVRYCLGCLRQMVD